MSMKKFRHDFRKHAEQRYEKQRRKNLLATPGIHNCIIVLDNLKAGFNVPKIFRSAEAFGIQEIHLINIGVFDPAPGKGAFKKVPARFYTSFDESYQRLIDEGYSIFVMEADQGNALTTRQLPEKSAFVFGHEEVGHSFELSDYDNISSLSIPQYGQVESLNVSVAASVVMYEYIRQHGRTMQQRDNTSEQTPSESKLRRKKNRSATARVL